MAQEQRWTVETRSFGTKNMDGIQEREKPKKQLCTWDKLNQMGKPGSLETPQLTDQSVDGTEYIQKYLGYTQSKPVQYDSLITSSSEPQELESGEQEAEIVRKEQL